MSRGVIAFVGDGPEAAAVFAMAKVLGDVFSTSIEAVHVGESVGYALAGMSEGAGVPLRVVPGDPANRIVEELAAGEFAAGVMGARRESEGPRPAGHIALEVITGVDEIIVVVPPDARVPSPGNLKRILVPLNGTEESAHAVERVCGVFERFGVEIVVLHVFDSETAPRFWDQPQYEAEAWGQQFLTRFLAESEARIKLRTGAPQDRVLDVASEEKVDMVALGWSQDLDPGRASVVRRMLAEAPMPLLLVPTP